MRQCPIRLTAFSAATIATMCAAAALYTQPARAAVLRHAGPTDATVYRLVATAAAIARDMSRQQTMPEVAMQFGEDAEGATGRTERTLRRMSREIRPSRHVEYRLLDLPPPAWS